MNCISSLPTSDYTLMLLASEPSLDCDYAAADMASPSSPASPWSTPASEHSPDSMYDSSVDSTPDYSLSPRHLPSLPFDSDLMFDADLPPLHPTLAPQFTREFVKHHKLVSMTSMYGLTAGLEVCHNESALPLAPIEAPASALASTSAPAESESAPALQVAPEPTSAPALISPTTPASPASAASSESDAPAAEPSPSSPVSDAPASTSAPTSKKTRPPKSRAPSKRTSEPQRFSCPDCSNSYTRRDGLARHIRSVHTHERPYKCDECGDAFALRSSLVEHMRRHTGEKPYSCRQCDMSFASNKSMHRHEFTQHGLSPEQPKKIHSRRLITCNVCDRTFKRQDQYKIHMKTHTSTSSSTYLCGTCQASLSSQAALNSHMQTHIPIETRMASYLGDMDELDLSQDMLSYMDDTNMTTTLAISSATHHLFSCTESGCGRLFSYASTLHHHQRTQHGHDTLSIPTLKNTITSLEDTSLEIGCLSLHVWGMFVVMVH